MELGLFFIGSIVVWGLVYCLRSSGQPGAEPAAHGHH